MVAKARLVEIQWDADQRQATPVSDGKTVDIQFNPETLKVTYANQNRGGSQPGGSGQQFVGSSTSKLSLELLFDTTEVRVTSDNQNDVRKKTESIAYFLKPKPPRGGGNSNRVPPGVSFEWGTFIFRGVVDSMDETLDYFSEQGVPMRATIALSIARQEIEFLFGTPGQANGAAAAAPGSPPPGAEPLEPAQDGDSVQRMAGREGRSNDWKSIAAANGIDNPLRMQAGALLNMSAGASVGIAAGASLGASAGASVSFGAGGSAGASFGAGASAGVGGAAGLSAGGQVGFSAGLGGGLGFSAGAGAGASAGVSASAGVGASAGASAGAGASFGAGASAGASFGAGVSAGASGGASFGAGASAGASFGAGATASLGAGASAGASTSFDIE